jgi:hypothetical protein
VISDDEDVGEEDAIIVTSKVDLKEERKEDAHTNESVIDISDDEMMADIPSIRSSTSRAARRQPRTDKEDSKETDECTAPPAIDPGDSGVLLPNGLLQSSDEMAESAEVNPKTDVNLPKAIPAIPPVVLPPSQTSDLEQALEEEEGEWNEGDEEGMGMEDLDINDDEEAVIMEAMDQPSVDADEQDDTKLGGEKRKRKGKQKALVVQDCSPEVIALDDSDQGDDDDSLGGREDVDDFDADDEECPICGRTFVGMRGDVSISELGVTVSLTLAEQQKRTHVTQCPGPEQAISGLKPGKTQQPISSFCTPGQPFSIKSERQKKADAEREREAAEVKSLKGPNAFKVLMSGNKEDEEWKVAEIDLKRDGKRSVGRRKAPFYKVGSTEREVDGADRGL